MATSGYSVGNLNDGGQVYVAWQLASQSVVNNRSTINWQVGWRFLSSPLDRQLDDGHAYLAGATRWDVPGRVKNYDGGPFTVRDWQAASGSFNVSHNADGTLAIEVGGGMTGFSAKRSEFAGAWFDLPRIPRGPRVKYAGAWHNSIAYVRSGGVWRIAVPYVKSGGVWKSGGN